jgi:hypothetical protein
MADEDTVLDEAMDNLKEAGQRIRATQSLMRSQGMTDGENHRDLLTRLSTALAMTKPRTLRPGDGGITNQPERHSTSHAVNKGRSGRAEVATLRPFALLCRALL